MSHEPNFTKHVISKEDFIVFLKTLIDDYRLNKEQWENKELGRYLEGMSYFSNSIRGFYLNSKIPFSENPDWKMFANILAAGRIYQ